MGEVCFCKAYFLPELPYQQHWTFPLPVVETKVRPMASSLPHSGMCKEPFLHPLSTGSRRWEQQSLGTWVGNGKGAVFALSHTHGATSHLQNLALRWWPGSPGQLQSLGVPSVASSAVHGSLAKPFQSCKGIFLDVDEAETSLVRLSYNRA